MNAPPAAEIVQVTGPVYLATLLNFGLLGSLVVQLYLYYHAFPNDRPFTKALVYTICLIETAQTIWLLHDSFLVFGFGFGDLATLTKVQSEWLLVPVVSGIVAFMGQSFYAYRVHVLSKSRIIPLIIVAISFTSSVAAFITGAFMREAGDLTLIQNYKTSVVLVLWSGAAALSDIAIAVCMTYYLTRYDTGFRQTDVLVAKLIRLIIETGSLTALIALANLVLFLAFPHRLYFTVMGGILSKMYANTILVVLNSRIKTIGGRGANMNGEFPSARHHLGSTAGTAREQPSVVITRDVFSDVDFRDRMEMKAMGNSRNEGSV